MGFVIIAILNLAALARFTGLPFDVQHFFLQLLSAGVGMLLTLRLLVSVTGGTLLGHCVQAGVGIAVYGTVLVLNGAIKYSDLRRLPWIGKYLG